MRARRAQGQGHPVEFVAFDLLAASGRELRPLGYDERLRTLLRLADGWRSPVVARSAADPGVAATWFDDLATIGTDGLVVKGATQAYRGG